MPRTLSRFRLRRTRASTGRASTGHGWTGRISTGLGSTHWRGGSRRQALYLGAWVLVATGLALVATAHWRKGLVVIAGTMILVGILRATLSARATGWLVVRGRTSDVVFCLFFGVVLAVTALLAVG